MATPASIETWDAAQDAEVRDILARVSDDRLAFLVVYGSMSRGDQRIDSDLDIYYETRDDAVELERTDPDSHAHVFGARSGDLLKSIRTGDEMAFSLVEDALVVYDDGTFRSIVDAARRARIGVDAR